MQTVFTGFQIIDVHHQVYLWHGEKDTSVKVETGRHVANQLPNYKSKFFFNVGHISLIYNHSEEILKLFVKE